ncbi:MAG: hypothetical protein E2O56_01360 [Gammaproteobacteria bacterium]|nr:MAG: hypothetical protein E2O56_01360 [Gammaproteobacteria bacterium]
MTQFLVRVRDPVDYLHVSMRSRQHYVFQHTILGGLVAREPMEVWPRFQPTEAERSIRSLWRQAGNLVPEQERIPFPEVHHVLTTVDTGDTKHLAIVFSFPKPWVRGEAFMGALIWRRRPTTVDWDDPDNAALHPLIYFTLEHGVSPRGASSTRMGAWRLDRNDEVEHVSFGSGPRPQVSDFLATAAAMLEAATPAPA